MERTLYHGSEFIIKKPEFLEGNIHNDYGIGFYCTTNKELAKEWASKRSGKGYINKYILRDDSKVDGYSKNDIIKLIESGILADTSVGWGTTRDSYKCNIWKFYI